VADEGGLAGGRCFSIDRKQRKEEEDDAVVGRDP
jgi:hypothetical protein